MLILCENRIALERIFLPAEQLPAQRVYMSRQAYVVVIITTPLLIFGSRTQQHTLACSDVCVLAAGATWHSRSHVVGTNCRATKKTLCISSLQAKDRQDIWHIY